jgi:hypothetical protein
MEPHKTEHNNEPKRLDQDVSMVLPAAKINTVAFIDVKKIFGSVPQRT